ncbi:hypothetical protein D3C80_2068050 [compost metagenome]
MLLSAEHLAYHHTAKHPGSRGHAIYFEARHGQARHQLVTGNLWVYPATQPLFTEFHPALLNNSVTVVRF